MTTDVELIERLIDREGGFVDHPADRGGVTKFGVTRPLFKLWRKEIGGYVPRTDDELATAIRNLKRAEAAEIYRVMVYDRHRLGEIAAVQLRAHVLDCLVLHGPIAVRWLQRAAEVEPDGLVGPVTLGAVNGEIWLTLNDRLFATRLRYLAKIVRRDPTQAVFLPGWINRALEFL